MSKRKLRNDGYGTRGESGKFQSHCGCIMHDEWTQDKLYNVRNISKSGVFGKQIIAEMRKRSFISPRGNILCTECYDTFKSM